MAKDSSDNTSAEMNIIGRGTVIDGNLRTDSNIRIDGKIKGKLICKHTLTIGEAGYVEGEVEAVNGIVSGKIKGKVNIMEKLVLHSKSSIIGDLKAKKLIIDEGAVFEGTSDMGIQPSGGSLKEHTAPNSDEVTKK
ncbi:MAG: polymer-forming cytoskeletal protein [Calditrichaceae bacterium]|nr:polymer-forming cytoskeletal protein [Calditrichaceae bacterium]MBN2707518.1 polymer-forming cytoskeletal protein [Calditrichaceae bacterium]RQV95607.1 MAG: polymer-forming cytoskeletal protein [Calditrichota bacterium]